MEWYQAYVFGGDLEKMKYHEERCFHYLQKTNFEEGSYSRRENLKNDFYLELGRKDKDEEAEDQ